MLISDAEDEWSGWDVGAPLTDYLCFGDVDGQPHPAVSLHSCIQEMPKLSPYTRTKMTILASPGGLVECEPQERSHLHTAAQGPSLCAAWWVLFHHPLFYKDRGERRS